MEKVLPVIFFLVLLNFGEASAFPGAQLKSYLQAYGPPTNLDETSVNHPKDVKVQYYWAEAELDFMAAGKKFRGNLIVLFDSTQGGLSSLRETFLTNITPEDFKFVMQTITNNWKIVSKSANQNSSRAYDLYRMISLDSRYVAEASYSLPESGPPLLHNPSLPETSYFNLWIQMRPND